MLIDDVLKELHLTRSQMVTETLTSSHEQNSENHLIASATNAAKAILVSPEKTCQKPQVHSTLCGMRILRQNIAAQKAQIMKNLELNNCNKRELDEEIAKLQHMQKQYIAYEKDMAYNDETPNRTDFCLSSDEGDVSSEDFLRGILGDAHSNSGESRDEKEKVSMSANNIDESVMVSGHNSSYRSNSLISRSQFDSGCKSNYSDKLSNFLIIEFRF